MKDISYRTMKIGEWHWKNHASAMYHVACDCGDVEHAFILYFDRDMPDVTLEIYADGAVLNPHRCDFTLLGFFKRHWWHIRKGIKLICGIYPECQSDLIVGDIPHIESLIDALKQGKEMMVESLKNDK